MLGSAARGPHARDHRPRLPEHARRDRARRRRRRRGPRPPRAAVRREPAVATREALVAALNGVLGDYLADTGNPLAIGMQFRRDGVPLPMERHALARRCRRVPASSLVLVHGLCLNDLQWNRRGHDHGAALARDLGYTPVYLHYNTGLHLSTNGAELADALEALVRQWPVPLDAISRSSRTAWADSSPAARVTMAPRRGHAWLEQLRTLVFLGTPHHGAPMERGGNWIDALLGVSPYSAPFARLGKIRSAGITDLRYGNLVHEDWQGRDRFARGDRRRFVPLPEGVRCYAIAATTARDAAAAGTSLPGDGLVPVASALGEHVKPELALHIPKSRQWIARGCGHLDLLGSTAVYRRIRRWLDAATPGVAAPDPRPRPQ